MAYIVRKLSQESTASASYTPTLPSHATDDLLLICITQDGGGTTISTATSGWNMIGTQAASGAARQAWAYKIAASGAETNPTFSGSNDEWISTTFIVRDADTTTPIDGNVRTDWNAVASSNSGSLTPSVNNCLLFYSWGADQSTPMRTKTNDLIQVEAYRGLTASPQVTHIIGTTQQYTAAAAPTIKMYCATNLEGGNGWVIAVRNKTNGSKNPNIKSGLTEVQWYGNFGTNNTAEMNPTWSAPSNFAATINSISVSTNNTTVANDDQESTPWGQVTRMTSNENLGAASWVGSYHTITSSDWTNKIFAVQWDHSSLSTSALMGSDGAIIGFKDGSGNWVTYQLRPKSLFKAGVPIATAIQLGTATAYASSGTMDWTTVSGILYAWHRASGFTSSHWMQVKNAVVYGTNIIAGGGASSQGKFSGVYDAMKSWGMLNLGNLQASAQIMSKGVVQIGDGSTETYFSGTSYSFEFPLPYDGIDYLDWRAGNSSAGLTIKASASDDIDLSATLMATNTVQPFTIDSASSTSALYDFTGASLIGYSVTWKTGVPCNGATFKSCGEIDAKGATFTNVTIANTTSTDAAIAFSESGGELDGCTIDVTGTSALYHLELGTACESITLTDVTFTGTPGTDKVHVRKTSGTVTISISGTTTLAAGDVTSEGATVSIVSDPVYQSVVVSGFTSGSRIQIYDTTNNTELFNGTASSGNTVVSGTTATWTDPATAAGDRAIRVRVAYVSGATAKEFQELTGLTCGTTSGTATVTYPVTQVNDTVYNNNAITGSGVTGVTFTDSSPDVVNIDVAANTISWKSIYAAWVYYAFTSTGIATDIDYIEGVDEANYILSNMKVKNTSSPSEPLEVTGGYGRDATTGAAIDLADTSGGTLVFAPDHVVSYAVGSGVTSQDKTDIATEVLNAAAAAPIAANIKKVADTTVNGSGTGADPWGP